MSELIVCACGMVLFLIAFLGAIITIVLCIPTKDFASNKTKKGSLYDYGRQHGWQKWDGSFKVSYYSLYKIRKPVPFWLGGMQPNHQEFQVTKEQYYTECSINSIEVSA